MNFSSSAAPAPPMMMNQYAQSPSSQSNLANQQPQCQPIYVTNQANQYGAAPASNQYASATVPSSGSGTGSGAASVVGQSPNQFPPSGSQNNFYGTNSQTSNYTTGGQVNTGQYSQSVGSQAAQYGSGGNQYGSNSSINQYAAGPPVPGPVNQYAITQSGQSQYGTNIVSQAQTQYNSSGQVQAAAAAGTTNPYGTPSNSVNQYATGGHHTVSTNAYAPGSGPPPPPMVSLAGPAAPPPPPPPPVPNANSSTAASSGSSASSSNDPPPDTNSLAAALQARLKKKQQQSQPVENSGSSTSSSGSGSGGGGGNYGTLGRGGGGGMASMMDEMAKTLARRRAAAEKKQPEQPPEPESSPDKKSWDKSNASNNKFSNGAESPKSVRKRFGSASEDTLLKVNGVNDGTSLTAQEMEAFKVEIIKEVRKEFQKMKQEIIDAVRTELNKR